LKLDTKKNETEGGHDYWVSSLSAICNSFKYNNISLINDKIHELEGKYEAEENKRTKIMFERNISILYSFENFDFKLWRPSEELTFFKKHTSDYLQNIRGFRIRATPQHVFSYKNEGIDFVGAIWFIAKLGGYRKEELGMFTDVLFRYLKNTYHNNYDLAPKYCIAVDTVNIIAVNYMELHEGRVTLLLDRTLDEINRLM
jgi:hypothetical protein